MTATTDATSATAGGLALDIVERGLLTLLGATVVLRIAPSLADHPGNLLVLISECLAVGFILFRRRAGRMDASAYAVTVGFLGTAAPLLVTPAGPSLIPAVLAVILMMGGLLINIGAKLALNRSFGVTAANRGVKRAGPYRYLRHPMYVGYVATQIGFLLSNASAWNLGVYLFAWSVQLLRIRAEERVLLEDPAYRAYAAEVRYRLIPGLY